MKNMIEVKNLLMIYGEKAAGALKLYDAGESPESITEKTGAVIAVNNISMSVREHELMVIMGLSGSGKSTFLKCLNLLNKPTRGEILVDAENIVNYDMKQLQQYRQRKVSMVFQDFGLLPHRKVIENVEFGLEVSGMDRQARRKKAAEMIELVGLTGWENRKIRELSGGMQQRVGLARALASDPEILLMDEPFSALDPLIRRQMQEELLKLQTILNKTIVFITHDISEAFALGDRIAIIKDGVIQQIGEPQDLIRAPQTEYISNFIKDINKTKVYRADALMNPCREIQSEESCADVSPDQTLEEILGLLLRFDVLKVVDADGSALGIVDRDSALQVFEKGLS